MSFICPLVYRTLSPLLEEEEERDEEKLFKRGVLHITSPCSQQWHKARMRCARALWEKLIHKSGELVPFPYILFAEALFHRVSFVLSAAAAAAAFSALSRLGWRESVKSRYERDARRRRDNSTRSLAFPHTYTHSLSLSLNNSWWWEAQVEHWNTRRGREEAGGEEVTVSAQCSVLLTSEQPYPLYSSSSSNENGHRQNAITSWGGGIQYVCTNKAC